MGEVTPSVHQNGGVGRYARPTLSFPPPSPSTVVTQTRRLIYSFVPFYYAGQHVPYFRATLCKKVGWGGMLTAHSNVLRIYVARFPASSRNFFIPFAHAAQPPRRFATYSGCLVPCGAPGKSPLPPPPSDPLRRAFCKETNFSTLEARTTGPTSGDHRHLLAPYQVPARWTKYRRNPRARGRCKRNPVVLARPRDGQCQCVRSPHVNTRTRSPGIRARACPAIARSRLAPAKTLDRRRRTRLG